MYKIQTEYCRAKPGAAKAIDPGKLVTFHHRLKQRSIWIVSPNSLFEETNELPLLSRRLTRFGTQVKQLIYHRRFHRTRYGTSDTSVLQTIGRFRPAAFNAFPAWTRTPDFDAQLVAVGENRTKSAFTYQEMLAKYLSSEAGMIQHKQSSLLVVSDKIMQGLLDEQGSPQTKYTYSIIITFDRLDPDRENGFEVYAQTTA